MSRRKRKIIGATVSGDVPHDLDVAVALFRHHDRVRTFAADQDVLAGRMSRPDELYGPFGNGMLGGGTRLEASIAMDHVAQPPFCSRGHGARWAARQLRASGRQSQAVFSGP